MMRPVPFLVPGDTIRIVSPAKAIEAEKIDNAKVTLENLGFNVELSPHCKDQYNYFSSTIENRLSDFQAALDDPKVKAVLCARGGYGCVQLVDRIRWNSFSQSPKWIIGLSDSTRLHHRVQKLGLMSIHGSMPLDFSSHSPLAIQTLIDSITKSIYSINS